MIRSVEKRSSRGLIDSYLSSIYREAVELDKNSFSKRGKTHKYECKQASYLTKDPINILSFQKHLSRRKCKVLIDQKHTHTKQV